ncbi:MAG: UDP-N-acetylmuramate--alanine ligase [delta proteobacterium ML8_D]|jgi:UDP-N-acetylmuramate--alanine ligase|nr:MAG: UDP-N-acetylmuramate--alanine ligase [delta proteobacterium ML8_D]
MYKKQHIHFVGIGGIGMSGLAQILLNLGYKVTGSDLCETEITRSLRKLGGTIYNGHAPENIQGADVVVISSAIRKHNFEVQEALSSQIPVIPRAEMLAELMRLKKFGVAVAGAHGKTSTTSMISSVLRSAGLDPTVIIGGKVNGIGSNAYWGQGEFLIAEADESDGSFLRLTPSIVVVTNIDREHLDYYSDLNAIMRCFLDFIDKIPFYGLAILCGDNPPLREMLSVVKKRIMTYGTGPECDLQARDISFKGLGVSFNAWWKGSELGAIQLKIPGLHHVRNSLAALALGLELEIPFHKIQAGLSSYEGVGRRFEILGETEGIMVVDDYAHHPTEIVATLKAARACWPERRLVVLFEPHRYTRTQALMDDFTTAFGEADELWLTEIYPASETPIVGVSGKRLARNMRNKRGVTVHYIESCGDLPHAIMSSLQEGDVVMTLGAGAIGHMGPRILDMLKTKESVVAL